MAKSKTQKHIVDMWQGIAIKAVEHYMTLLGLSTTWDIKTEVVPSLPDGSTGMTNNAWPYKQAHIKFAESIFTSSDWHYQLKVTAAHEVGHVFVAEHFEGDITRLIGGEGLLADMLHDKLEGLVDALAHILVGMEEEVNGSP